jgi:diguanylate cyclase (GGDEF)-like protein
MKVRHLPPLLLVIAIALAIGAPLAAQPAASAAKARALLDRGATFEKNGRLDEAMRDYAAALALGERAGDRALSGDALQSLAFVQYYRGDTNAALVNLRRAYDLESAAGNADGQRSALSSIAHIYADARIAQYDRAIEYYRQVLPQYEAAGAAEEVADTLFNIGSTYESKEDLDAALEWYRRALAAEEKLGRSGEAAYVKRSIAVTLGKLGRAREALPLLDDALRTLVATNDTDRAMAVRQSRGIVHRRVGNLDIAIADLEESRAWFEKQKNTRFLQKSDEELALAYSAAGRWREAYEASRRDSALQRELAEKMREEHTSRLRVQFDAERKERENRALLRDKAADERIRRLQTIILILGAAIILVLASFAVRLVRDGRRMRVMAMTDELTRLPNRRHILAAAEEQLRHARATGEPLSVIVFDIDHFKRVNDAFGHAAGDTVLQHIAHVCRAVLRPNDRIGRIGGEEFLIGLPSTREPEAVAIAERLRASVEAIEYTDLDPSLRVTISLGVAEWLDDVPLTRLTARADEGLYRAKKEGRNRVAA